MCMRKIQSKLQLQVHGNEYDKHADKIHLRSPSAWKGQISALAFDHKGLAITRQSKLHYSGKGQGAKIREKSKWRIMMSCQKPTKLLGTEL